MSFSEQLLAEKRGAGGPLVRARGREEEAVAVGRCSPSRSGRAGRSIRPIGARRGGVGRCGAEWIMGPSGSVAVLPGASGPRPQCSLARDRDRITRSTGSLSSMRTRRKTKGSSVCGFYYYLAPALPCIARLCDPLNTRMAPFGLFVLALIYGLLLHFRRTRWSLTSAPCIGRETYTRAAGQCGCDDVCGLSDRDVPSVEALHGSRRPLFISSTVTRWHDSTPRAFESEHVHNPQR